MLVLLSWMALVGAQSACGDEHGGASPSTCEHPDKTTYDQAPIASGLSGCVGGPTLAGPGQGDVDADKTFPVGTRATLASCTYVAPSVAQTCDCLITGSDGSPRWSCPL